MRGSLRGTDSGIYTVALDAKELDSDLILILLCPWDYRELDPGRGWWLDNFSAAFMDTPVL